MMTGKLSRVAIEINTERMKDKTEVVIRALGNALEKLDRKKRVIDTEKFRKNAVLKMKDAVGRFVEEVTAILIENTPVGDDQRLATDKGYRRLYEWREEGYGIPAYPGYHQGAYTFSKSKNPPFIPEIVNPLDTISRVMSSFKSNFKIGDVFYISAKGPAYGLFEKGQVGSPVARPTLNTIMQIYSIKKIS